MIVLSPSKEMSKDAVLSEKIPIFQNEAETLMQEIKGKEKYEPWSLYHGLAFRSFKKGGFSQKELEFMEKNLCIFSALYGVLSARDGISKYRLDFSKKGLYAYWGDKIYQEIIKRCHSSGEWIINLASDEFSKTLSKYLTEKDRFLQIDFLEEKNGEFKKHSSISKKGRGAMARYLILSQDTSLERIQNFQEDDFEFREDLSTERHFVFVKRKLK